MFHSKRPQPLNRCLMSAVCVYLHYLGWIFQIRVLKQTHTHIRTRMTQRNEKAKQREKAKKCTHTRQQQNFVTIYANVELNAKSFVQKVFTLANLLHHLQQKSIQSYFMFMRKPCIGAKSISDAIVRSISSIKWNFMSSFSALLN